MKILTLAFAWIMVSCASEPTSTSRVTVFRAQTGDPAPRIAAFCLTHTGQRVGNGECWTLADDAFKSAGTRRPGRDLRVWGRVVNPSKESLKPGDVIEYQSARFSDGTITGTAHTAVVVRAGNLESFSIAEQNWGRKTVRVREMNLKTLVSGKVTVYRPQ